jgi:hypothetical protein
MLFVRLSFCRAVSRFDAFLNVFLQAGYLFSNTL